MAKPRYWARLIGAFVGRFKGILFFGILFGFFLFIILSFLDPFFVNKNSEYIGMTGRYHIEELPQDVLLSIGEGLTRVNEKGEVLPGLAQSWENIDDGKTWVFHLKKDITWHDGTPVTSATINYHFEDVVIERPDQDTVVMKLASPFAPFLTVVARPTFKKGLLGTGEWKVNKISLAGSYVETLILIDKDENKKIIHFYPTQDRAKLAFKLGQVDTLVDLLDPSPFENWGTVNVIKKVNENRYVAVFFNNEDPILGGKELRQALAYAIDKNVMPSERALGPISPSSWAYNPQIKTYDYNKERAIELIKKMNQETLKDFDLKLVTTPALLPIAETIEKYWEEVGIGTTVQVSSVVPTEFQAFLVIYDIPKDPDQYITWHSSQDETNIAKYKKNQRIDKLLEDGRLEMRQEERKKIYLDFQRFLLEDAPAIFLYHPYSYTIKRK